MTPRTHKLQARLSDEDASFLSQLHLPGAVSPSEKLRGLLAEMRGILQDGDYKKAASFSRGMLMAAACAKLREAEQETGMRSDLVERTGDWLGEALAFFQSASARIGNPDPKPLDEELREFEAGLVDRLVRILEFFIRLGLSDHSPCYNPDQVRAAIAAVARLTNPTKAQDTQQAS